MLPLLLILSVLGRLTSANYNSETSLLQITIPQKIQTNRTDGDESEMHVTYAIKFDRKIYTIHLEKQSFLDSHFLVYLYNKSGILYTQSPFVKGHCFYQGYVAEIRESVVTLSICSGLRGLLQLENVSYGIEPLEFATTYEHMLYQINNKIDFPYLKENYPRAELADEPYRIFVKSEKHSDVALLKRILKIQVIMDKALYDYMGAEVAVATEKITHIFSIINSMFSQLNVTVMLSSLEIWSDKNKISSDGPADEVLQRFVSWKEKVLFQKPNHMAYLLIYRDHLNHVGTIYHGKVCDPKFAAGIALYPKMVTSEAFSVVMAQLLGISLGLTYDDIYNCHCPGSICIMNPEAIHSHGVKFFSSCSMDEFKHVISQPEFECLQKQTVSTAVFQRKIAVCGNGVLEPPEECDCGTAESCNHKKCCQPEDCSLIRSAECGSGPCCDNKTCLVAPKGRVCRKSTNPCDFTEYCNGQSEFCVADMKSLDLEPCGNESAYCYGGVCRDRDTQCVELFGKFAKESSALCTQEVNFLSDGFGYCIPEKACDFTSILCGKLTCHWTHAQITQSELYDVQYTYLGGQICMSARTREKIAAGKRDKTFPADGTMCGYNRYCLRRACKSVTANVHCDSRKNCSGHGLKIQICL
ncbi:A disintegrin and metallopeptidase domain 3-like isoform X2 [Talpa occidentalis]|uniref:A disintegrin and metallopeptidase domain 3-like isoform X2 n=1 Tax=Talpa occidentalis TaxID=50954 RepID=UPI0023F79BA2|nr:A disintegrin and metallopeptidase domain 3-like isoform X2 [Talpa occidentalis]